MKKLGIIGAMDLEIDTLLSLLTHKETRKIAGAEYASGKLEGLDVVIVRCGIGKVNAAISAQILCDCYQVTHLVNTGIAGSLDAALDIGDLVVSQDAMYHDMDCVAFGYPMGQVPQMDTLTFPADETLIAYAFAAAEKIHPGHVRLGRVASGDQFVASKEKKDAIVSVTHGLCTEMEGTAIAHTAYRNGVPYVILRAISDKADDSAHMDYPAFEAQAARRCAQVTCALARKLQEEA